MEQACLQVPLVRAETKYTMSSLFRVPRPTLLALALGCAVSLSACDYLGVESSSQVAQQKAADGKAVGGACRHANRAIEDCYRLNPKAVKSAVFDGWREMDTYMRENNIQAVIPTPEPPKPAVTAEPTEPKEEDDKKH